MNDSGAYWIRNLYNGKIYIGSSVRIRARLNNHRTKLNSNIHENPHLQCAWNKYGESNFEFRTLQKCDRDMIIELEQYFLDLVPQILRYNFGDCAQHPMFGRSPAANTRKKISKTLTGRTVPLNIREKISNSMRGPDNHFYGKNHSNETKLRISKLKKSESNSWRGQSHSEETKIKMRNSNRSKRAVLRIDIDTGNIKQYDSVNSTKDDGFNYKSVHKVCKGERHTHKGFVWLFADDLS